MLSDKFARKSTRANTRMQSATPGKQRQKSQAKRPFSAKTQNQVEENEIKMLLSKDASKK